MTSIYKEDCKWYDYWQDRGARIPFCKAGKNMDASGFFLETCDECKDYGNKNVTTNADHIRAMTDDVELAKYLCKLIREGVMMAIPGIHYSSADIEELNQNWLDWLKTEVDDG